MNAARSQLGSKAEKTHAAILDAAEELFAQKGFAATRLEDIAERVGIKRASLVYYYKDKHELYADVLKSVFGGLYEKLRGSFEKEGPVAERVENMVGAWVDYVIERPSLTRLLMREIADADPKPSQAIMDSVLPFFQMIQKAYVDSAKEMKAMPDPMAALGFSSLISGSTVFFLTALPALSPSNGKFPLTSQQIATHRDGLMQLTRMLFQFGVPRPKKP